MKYKASNSGLFAQAVKVIGGTQTIKSGAKDVPIETKEKLSPERLEHFKERGVTFSTGTKRSRAETAKIKKLETAVTDAEKALEAVEGSGDDAAHDAALDALSEAEKALEEATG